MEFRSHVPRLLLHREASQVIADIYELHSNSAERAILLRDFYGREAALLPLTLSSEDATKDVRGGLPVVLQGSSEEQRRRILTSLRENLDLMSVHSLFQSHLPTSPSQVQQPRKRSYPSRHRTQSALGVSV